MQQKEKFFSFRKIQTVTVLEHGRKQTAIRPSLDKRNWQQRQFPGSSAFGAHFDDPSAPPKTQPSETLEHWKLCWFKNCKSWMRLARASSTGRAGQYKARVEKGSIYIFCLLISRRKMHYNVPARYGERLRKNLKWPRWFFCSCLLICPGSPGSSRFSVSLLLGDASAERREFGPLLLLLLLRTDCAGGWQSYRKLNLFHSILNDIERSSYTKRIDFVELLARTATVGGYTDSLPDKGWFSWHTKYCCVPLVVCAHAQWDGSSSFILPLV